MPEYIVKQGDCMVSIAEMYGMRWETVWADPKNAELRKLRKDPMVLYSGDRVFITEKQMKTESVMTEQRYRFVRKGIPPRIKIRICNEGQPLAGEPYKFFLEGRILEGSINGEGYVEVPVPSGVRHGILFVGEGSNAMEIDVDLGGLDPVDTIIGVQKRLSNLGLEPGMLDGIMGPNTRAALQRFQKLNELEPTGELDERTREKLKEKHGS